MNDKKEKWFPEFVYEEGSQLPFVEIPCGEKMPDRMFWQEYQHTGEFEDGEDEHGKHVDVPVCDVEIRMYMGYHIMQKVLTPELLDEVRAAFGMEPAAVAAEKGKQITENAQKKADENNARAAETRRRR